VGDFEQQIYLVSIMALPFLLAVTWREALRGYAAHKMGDTSVQASGRLSANPLNHADPLWTGVIPVVAFVLLQLPILLGQAKPIPINPGGFKNYRKGVLYLALAGPTALFFMIALWAYVYRFGPTFGVAQDGWLMQSAAMGAQLSSYFLVIGLLPIPGLDGGKIIEHFLPHEAAQSFRKVERFAFFIVIGIFILLPAIISVPANFIFGLVATLVGV